MTDGQKNREEKIFYEALEKSPEQREAFLKDACGKDRQLYNRVKALLKAHDVDDSFLENPPMDSEVTVDTAPVREVCGSVIGRYKLLEQIGEGGMAVVFMAEQTQPFQRRVALKIIKLGMDTKQVIARFEAERQALALLDHPNIANIHDAGTTETGRPYFVMELVRGISITEYCDKNNLSTHERLRLFIPVCHAIQHAHQKGIIHRDIKPSNVLVTMHDGTPMPKVIDFGIAKAVNQRLTEKTLFTRFAQMIGTPEYMSPEQAEMSALDIDTRTDVYSLGVLLYELLTGTTPFGPEQLREKGYAEMQRIIRETEPVKPSTKISTLGDTLTEVAKQRKTNPDGLKKLFRGDLDWIVMKTLEKDRTRRYQAAHALCEDIEHHLNHEPVTAAAPSLCYRLQKLLRRRRMEAISTILSIIVLLTLAISLDMWRRSKIEAGRIQALTHTEILSTARDAFNSRDFETALKDVTGITNSIHVGPDARLLRANILLEANHTEEAIAGLEELLNADPEIAGTAHLLLARLYWESELDDSEKKRKVDIHRSEAQRLLPETADSYYMRAMNAATVKESMVFLSKAIALDPRHYESLRLRGETYRISENFADMEDDALAMIISQPRNPRGYALRAIARRGLQKYTKAIEDHDLAIKYASVEDSKYVQFHKDRFKTLLEAGEYQRLIDDAENCLDFKAEEAFFRFHIFCAHTALGEYERAASVFREVRKLDSKTMELFINWSMKYVFDTLDAGKHWHPEETKPDKDEFLFMNEAREYYNEYSSKFRRMPMDGFSPDWSPDGKKIAFSIGIHRHSGVAVYDFESRGIELLVVPGKDPRYSPDGKYIAFVRERRVLPFDEMLSADFRYTQKSSDVDEIWIVEANGAEPRRLAMGGWPTWSPDSQRVYYKSRTDPNLYSIAIDVADAKPSLIMHCPGWWPLVSADGSHVSYIRGTTQARKLRIARLSKPQEVVSESEPLLDGWCANWAPDGCELSLGGDPRCSRMGLWIFNRETEQLAKVLNGMACQARWSPDGSKLALYLGFPFQETWVADLPSGLSTIEALGVVQTEDEHYRQLADHYEKIIKLAPTDRLTYIRLMACYRHLNDEQALARASIGSFTARIQEDPNNVVLYYCRGVRYENAGMIGEALVDYEAAVGLKPDYVWALNNLAWLYATCSQAQFRDGAKAVRYATRLCELTDHKDPSYIDTLGAAHAEAGDFEAAVKLQKRAIGLLSENISEESRADYESRLKLYQEGKPYRDSP